ncbi:MAG: hypothetical protein CM1200mP18_08220 [Gammaproteobacteria bacterium]|nr:MAG: hypothetical protein CM1200mP18_08220 [Gammaproteobacteria bacterium]
MAHQEIDILDVPEPFNFFQNSPVVADGRTGVVNPPSKAGDRIVFEVLMDLVVRCLPALRNYPWKWTLPYRDENIVSKTFRNNTNAATHEILTTEDLPPEVAVEIPGGRREQSTPIRGNYSPLSIYLADSPQLCLQL